MREPHTIELILRRHIESGSQFLDLQTAPAKAWLAHIKALEDYVYVVENSEYISHHKPTCDRERVRDAKCSCGFFALCEASDRYEDTLPKRSLTDEEVQIMDRALRASSEHLGTIK